MLSIGLKRAHRGGGGKNNNNNKKEDMVQENMKRHAGVKAKGVLAK